MFLIFYRINYPVAQHLEGHQEFAEKSLDLWLYGGAKYFATKDQSTLAQHVRHRRISRRCYGHFSCGGSPSTQLRAF